MIKIFEGELSIMHIGSSRLSPAILQKNGGHYLRDGQVVGCSVGWFNYLIINVDVRVEQSTP